MRLLLCALALSVVASPSAAEVTRVVIARRTPLAGGHVFGAAGGYEELTGTIQFALAPSRPANRGIIGLDTAARAADGRVHFTADLRILRPADPARANGVLLFEVANRGRALMLGTFQGASAVVRGPGDLGDPFLLARGFTLVWVGWEFDLLDPDLLSLDAPRPAGEQPPVSVGVVPDRKGQEVVLADAPLYAPSAVPDALVSLTVRDDFWAAPTRIPAGSWRVSAEDRQPPRLHLDAGFQPGRLYTATYKVAAPRVAGVGFAALRDAASAFRYRTDLPAAGTTTMVFGSSQSGRFLRQFLAEGFNADERDRPVFDGVWAHIAGAAVGSFNGTVEMPTSLQPYRATRFPFTDLPQQDPVTGRQAGVLARYGPSRQPRVFYTNTSVEYWGLGRAAALIHTTLDGRRDAEIPPNVRIYTLAGTQHGSAPFPPVRTTGRERPNPTPQRYVMRALMEAFADWVVDGTKPPDSRYPRLADQTLTPRQDLAMPKLPGASRLAGVPESRLFDAAGAPSTPLPFLVPQTDGDGNERGGIRMPDVSVPLGTLTGWNFRDSASGGPDALVPLMGAFIPFARTRAEREAAGDRRPSIAERYPDERAYLAQVDAAIAQLVADRFVLRAARDRLRDDARRRYAWATGTRAP